MNLKTAVPAYAVHLFTACGMLAGFLSLLAVYQGHYPAAFAYNGVAILIDSLDGLLARKANVKKNAALVDGALMDNLIDYVTYTVMPAFFFATTPLLPENIRIITLFALLLSSTFQFSNMNAKTKDHFFLGFPSYWNIVALYLWIWQLSPIINASIIWSFSVLSFVPIKFIYPSRIDFLSKKAWVKQLFTGATIVWGIATGLMLFLYPHIPIVIHLLVIAYVVWYTWLSVAKTLEKGA